MPFLLLWHPRSTAGPRPPPKDLHGDWPRFARPESDDEDAMMFAATLLQVITRGPDG